MFKKSWENVWRFNILSGLFIFWLVGCIKVNIGFLKLIKDMFELALCTWQERVPGQLWAGSWSPSSSASSTTATQSPRPRTPHTPGQWVRQVFYCDCIAWSKFSMVNMKTAVANIALEIHKSTSELLGPPSTQLSLCSTTGVTTTPTNIL